MTIDHTHKQSYNKTHCNVHSDRQSVAFSINNIVCVRHVYTRSTYGEQWRDLFYRIPAWRVHDLLEGCDGRKREGRKQQ